METLYQVLVLFALGSFFGWVFERLLDLVQSKKKEVDRFFAGPYATPYGIAAIPLFYIFQLGLPAIQYIPIATAICILTELSTGWIAIEYFKIKSWDYSDHFLNFRGIISLQVSVIWAIMSTFTYYFIIPSLQKMLSGTLSNLALLFLVAFYIMVFLDLRVAITQKYRDKILPKIKFLIKR